MASAAPLPKVALILQVKITIDPKDTERFLSHFKAVHAKVLAEPECAYFIVGQSAQEPGTFRWTEGWTKDIQWFMTVSNLFAVQYTRQRIKLMLITGTSHERLFQALSGGY
jgi:hypothetical protein